MASSCLSLSTLLPLLLLLRLRLVVRAGVPAPAQFYKDQLLDHTNRSDTRTWTQRYYTHEKYFQGPGSPIFVIMGGEGAIEPSTGLMYPFVAEHLARDFGAFVLQPEHRFYGASQPICPCKLHKMRQKHVGVPDPRERLLTYEQALLDAVALVEKTRQDLGCARDRFSTSYCPVISVGGSYPGFLSAMSRIVHPHIFDMAYAASAPMKFYAQQVDQAAYYNHISAVAEKAHSGCRQAVQSTLMEVQTLFQQHSNMDPEVVGVCSGSVPDYSGGMPSTFLDELFMMVGYTFANMNMAYCPPSNQANQTALYRACRTFLHDDLNALERLRIFLVRALGDDNTKQDDCFDMSRQRPSGPNATISAGDWSGVGTGQSGESWDFQTCTLCVEAIGFNQSSSMFPERAWSLDWLTRHCQSRFGVKPDPNNLNRRWGIDAFGNGRVAGNATNILFTNGLNDGWSVSGIRQNLSRTVLALNFPNGAHHSDLSGRGPSRDDTPDIQRGFVQVRSILASWLNELPSSKSNGRRRYA